MRFHILTLFPEMVMQGLNTSIIGNAVEQNLIEINVINIRDFTKDRHKKVDDYPYGGGAGMVMQAQPIYDAWKSIVAQVGYEPRCVYLTPQGQVFAQGMAKEYAREEDLIFLCGHYEGVDERVLEEIVTDYVSIGDYVLTNEESGSTESLEGGLLEYPQYSRPANWNGKEVPQVLLSGDHKKIESWRHEQSVQRTLRNRPELLEEAELSRADVKQILKQLKK